MGSDLGTSGSFHLSAFGRYAQESHKRATVENDFMVLKKVRARVSCSTRILSTRGAQSPVLGWEAEGGRPSCGIHSHAACRGASGRGDIYLDTGTPGQDPIEG